MWLKNVKHLTGRLFRWSLKLSMFEYNIVYEKRSTNVKDDMFSRNFISLLTFLLGVKESIEMQVKDNICGENI